MTRTFISVTQDDIDAKLAENIHSREMELAAYDFELAAHQAAIDALGNISWDATTTPYKGLSRDAMITRAIANGLDSDTIQKINDLNSLQYHMVNLEAVKAETAKSERQYNNLLASLPDGDRRTNALDVFNTKQAAVESATLSRVQ